MQRAILAVMLAVAAAVFPGAARAAPPDVTGTWECEPSPFLIRDQWSSLTYMIDIASQRDALFTAEMHWSLPPGDDVTGNQGGESSFSGTIRALGVIGWDDETIEMVAYGDGHRHTGTIVDADTIRFVHSETGDNAWVSRSVCHRTAAG